MLKHTSLKHFALAAVATAALASTWTWAESQPTSAPVATASAETLMSYRRLLPLEGGSNFRDLGGYPTADGHTVKRGLLFRSGAMAGLTPADEQYLGEFGFKSVVDLRSDEELDLYPNAWAQHANLNYVHHDYSMMDMMKQAATQKSDKAGDYSGMYNHFMDFLKPQLTLYFNTLLNGDVPAVVNCSAGQDRTGVTSALLLTTLGVDRELVIEDYLLSTDFREPLKEKGNVDLEEAAETNAFAAMMLKYGADKDTSRPNPLITADGTPLVLFTLKAIDEKYGSVAAYLEQELGIDAQAQAKLRTMYLQ